jgi:predicted nucleic acid-binding protein
MPVVVVDTTVLIDHLRGHQGARSCLRGVTAQGDELWSVTVVRTEVLAGARASELDATRTLLGSLRWLDVTVELADAAGRLAARYRRSHSGIDIVDYLVAAATQRLDATLLTRNVRHFPMIEGLRAAYV